MATKKSTSFVCMMLTAALVWSSLGVGLLSAPASIQSDVVMDAMNPATVPASDPTTESVMSTIEKPIVGMSNFDDVGQRTMSASGRMPQPTAAPWGNWSYREAHNVPEVAAMGITGDGVTVAIADTGIDFGVQNLAGKYMTVDDPDSPYFGWPVAFDAYGLPEFIMAKEARPGMGGIANTSLNGTGPFDIDHVIKVDGQRDFYPNELVGTDRRFDINSQATSTGLEFDLNELWASRDSEFWYAGMKTWYAQMNRTFGIAIDFDGPASGSIHDPHGNLLDFEASHSAPIDQISYSAAKNLVATCAGSSKDPALTNSDETNTVKIWDVNGNLVRTLPEEPYKVASVVWSPSGNLLAYETAMQIVVYETSTWTEEYRISHSISLPASVFRESMSFSPNGTIIAAGSLAASTEMQILNVLNGESIKVNPGAITRSVAYSPDGWTIALGQEMNVQLMNSTDYSLLTNLISSDGKPIETLAWSPDGMYLATGKSAGGDIAIWDVGTGVNIANLTGHGATSTVNVIKWTSTRIISGADDGKIIYWNPANYSQVNSYNSRYNVKVLSMDINQATGDIFLGTEDCTMRKYPSGWSANPLPFANQKPDVMIYIRYEREYYDADKKLSDFDKIEDPIVYKWETDHWTETNITNIFGKAFYKGFLAGEFTEVGFIEVAIPRNFTAWPNKYDIKMTSFICGDNASRPQDTCPSDYNVPSPLTLNLVNWTGTRKTTLSAWSDVIIPKVTINTTAIPSQGGIYHFGYHPSGTLTAFFGSSLPMVVTKSTSGEWDRVYVDMNLDYVINAQDTFVSKANPVLTVDVWNATVNPVAAGTDGVPDISGGMLYFIANGEQLMPYSERVSDLLVEAERVLIPFGTPENPWNVPKNGEVVAFYGDMDYDIYTEEYITSGTKMASTIAAQGLNEGDNGLIKGISPDITFLPICNAHYDLPLALNFAIDGYDGIPNSGDEAQIVAIGQYTTGYGNGLDSNSLLVETLIVRSNSSVVFVSPAGNDGSGYGTVAAPCSINTLVVGFTQDNTFVSGEDVVHHYSQVSELSSRGPTAAGIAKPDVVALGMGWVDMPLGTRSNEGGDSKLMTDIPNSELATAVTSGVMALIFEAFHDKYSRYPTTQEAMMIIRSTAKDLGHDSLTQGSGFVDALAAVRTAQGASGLIASSSKTSFGDTFGLSYDSFINVMAPGQAGSISVELNNPGTAAIPVQYNFEYMTRIDIQEFYQTVDASKGFKGDISNMVPANAEIIKVTIQTNYSWDEAGDTKTFLAAGGNYNMKLYDWIDSQPIGNYVEGYGRIDTSELSYLAGVDYGYTNSMICTIANPHNDLEGRLVIEIMPASDSRINSRPWRITVESFATSPTSWITPSKTGSTIAAGGNDKVNVTANVPADALPGTYSGAFVAQYQSVSDVHEENIMPTALSEDEYLSIVLNTTNWDNGSIGNYWSDYTTKYPAATINGTVWDTPYEFNTPGKRDNFPLVDPVDIYPMTVSNPIIIASNADFPTYATWGDGTPGSPWVIEYLEIDGTAFSQNGIEISGTTDHFIIKNCDIHDSQGYGIIISGSENVVVANCNIYAGTSHGIYIESSQNILIDNNNLHDNGGNAVKAISTTQLRINENEINANANGIGIELLDYAVISGNEIFDNGGNAIEIKDGNYNNITGNYIHDVPSDTGYGVWIEGSSGTADGNTVYFNRFENFSPIWPDTTGLTFYMAGHANTVVNQNDFINCDGGANITHAVDVGGMALWYGNYWSNDPNATAFLIIDIDEDGIADISDNSPQAALVSQHQTYHLAAAPILISSDADFAVSAGVLNPGAAGTYEDPFIISGWAIDSLGTGYAIKIENTSAYFVIEHCRINSSANDIGIVLMNAPNGVILYNHIFGVGIGVSIEGTDSSWVYLNTIVGPETGISILSSVNVTVDSNDIQGGMHGVRILNSETCNVWFNNISGHSSNGIIMGQSMDCLVAMNSIDSNGYGIHLANATGFNWIFWNNIIDNTVQAYDDFVGDSMASFELFSKFGNPANYTDIYDVWMCNITINGVPLTSGYILDQYTGTITFTPALAGLSGGAHIEIRAVLVYEQEAPAIIRLPHTRLTDGAITVKLNVTLMNGSAETKTIAYDVHRKVGIIELNSTFNIEMGYSVWVTYTYYNRTTIVPMNVNIFSSQAGTYEFGSKNTTEAPNLMPVWGVRPGQGAKKDSGERLVSGDRRYFFVDVPNQGRFSISELANFFLYNELSWNMNLTDINMFVYGKGSTSTNPNALPYTMNKLGGSEEKPDFSFFTATGREKELLVTPFNHEILVICISAKSFNGSGQPVNAMEGRGGWVRLGDNAPKTWTNSLVGHLDVSFQTSIELDSGIFASVVGPAQGSKSIEEIYQDDLSLYDLSTMEGWLTMNAVAGFTKVFTVENALSWDVRIIGHPMCPDLDLAVFLDGKAGQPKDGIAQWQEIITKSDMQYDAYMSSYGSGSYAYCADADADEAIKFISPPNGDYIVKVLGFTVQTQPGFFDLEVKTIFAGVEGYKLQPMEPQYEDLDPANGNYMSTDPVEPLDIRTFSVQWAFPEETKDDAYGGIFVIGTPESQKLIVFSVDIVLDRKSPTVTPSFPSPNAIISNNRPVITAKLEDPSRGELDPNGATVMLDGQDITQIATISITETENSAAVPGYWVGDILFTPTGPLAEGGHTFTVEAKDLAGNPHRISWGFTVDTTKPVLILSNMDDVIYTNTASYSLDGTTEPSSIVSVVGAPNIVRQRIDNTFSIDLELEAGENTVLIKSTDLAGNVYESAKTIIMDVSAPAFKRVVALDGSNTNKRMTGIYGEVSEAGSLQINGQPIQVNSDGSFRHESIQLIEGRNQQVLKFTDMAGNVAYNYMNITMDTAAPILMLSGVEKTVYSESLNITGQTETGVASLTINGKLVSVDGTGNFQQSIRLSPGTNTIVIEGKDRAGNSAQEVLTVNYVTDTVERNWAAIGLMVVLLVVGLILGLFLAPIILGKGKEPVPEEDIPAEEIPDEVPAGDDMPVEEIPEDIPEIEDVPAEEAVEEVPGPDAEPIPVEESMPEEVPSEQEAVTESEVLPEEPVAPAEPEDPRIVKLRDAYESGKISKELYEKNLAKFKGQ